MSDDWSIPATLKYPPTNGPDADWWEKRAEWYRHKSEKLEAENNHYWARLAEVEEALAALEEHWRTEAEYFLCDDSKASKEVRGCADELAALRSKLLPREKEGKD